MAESGIGGTEHSHFSRPVRSRAVFHSGRVEGRVGHQAGAFDADAALTYLTEDGIATGAGHTGAGWGSPDGFRGEVSLAQAQHFYETVTGCENQGESGTGVSVRCAFDYHLFRSDEIGRGPYTGNYWDIVVSDGKITSAVQTQAYITNGSSAEMWEPFQAWVASTHPEDLQVVQRSISAHV